jgi:transcriptional regulator PpsR
MSDQPWARPDITLTLNGDGVIQTAVPSKALSEEQFDAWRGRRWSETIEPAISLKALQSVDDIRRSGNSSCFQVRQRFPSGRELLMEYTTISLGERSGFVAIGRNLQTVADLQSQLIAAQQAQERDYWKIREIETRYRTLLDASNDAVALVRVGDLRVVEANQAAAKSLRLATGGEFCASMNERDKRALSVMLDRVREQGRAPGIALHLSGSRAQWSLRASLVYDKDGALFLFHMEPMIGGEVGARAEDPFSLQDLLRRLPDGFAIVDREGLVRFANDAFLDLVQIGAQSAIIGQKARRWLSRPGADLSVILDMVKAHGFVRCLSTALEGELGSIAEVEISATGNQPENPDFIGLLARDVTMRQGASLSREAGGPDHALPDAFSDSLSLESLVRATTEAVERKAIANALARYHNNRTATAKHLGLSRQSLHAKLNKYAL